MLGLHGYLHKYLVCCCKPYYELFCSWIFPEYLPLVWWIFSQNWFNEFISPFYFQSIQLLFAFLLCCSAVTKVVHIVNYKTKGFLFEFIFQASEKLSYFWLGFWNRFCIVFLPILLFVFIVYFLWVRILAIASKNMSFCIHISLNCYYCFFCLVLSVS